MVSIDHFCLGVLNVHWLPMYPNGPNYLKMHGMLEPGDTLFVIGERLLEIRFGVPDSRGGIISFSTELGGQCS